MPLQTYLDQVSNSAIKDKLTAIFSHLDSQHPDLQGELKWKKPMFSKDGAFIIGFDAAKKHLSVISEPYAMAIFADQIKAAGCASTSNLFKIAEDQDLPMDLLEAIIAFKREDKAGATTYFK